MKFAAGIIAIALAISAAQCSVVSWPWASEVAGHGLSYTAVSGPSPALWAAPSAAAWAPAASAWSAWPSAVAHAPAAVSVASHAAPVVVAAAAPAAVAWAPAEGSYIAKTRGAVHTAPLSGHIQSVANLNVAPAPGTL